jgi:hypothetical protein
MASKLVRNTSLKYILIKSQHFLENQLDLVNNGTNKTFIGAGFTVVGPFAKSLLTAMSYQWDASDRPAPCMSFDFSIQGGRPSTLLHCSSDKVASNDNAKLGLFDVEVPLKYAIRPLTNELYYAWSNNEGSMVSF